MRRVSISDCAIYTFSFFKLDQLQFGLTDLIFITIDCSNPQSVIELGDLWILEARHKSPNVPIVLVGTKIDLRSNPTFRRNLLLNERRKPISYDQGEKLARELGCLAYVETSALTGEGVYDLPEIIFKSIHAYKLLHSKEGKEKKCELM